MEGFGRAVSFELVGIPLIELEMREGRQRAKGGKGRCKGKELSGGRGRFAVWYKEEGEEEGRRKRCLLFVAGLFVCLLCFVCLVCTCLLLQSRWAACRGWRSCGIDVRDSSCIRRRR